MMDYLWFEDDRVTFLRQVFHRHCGIAEEGILLHIHQLACECEAERQ